MSSRALPTTPIQILLHHPSPLLTHHLETTPTTSTNLHLSVPVGPDPGIPNPDAEVCDTARELGARAPRC
jgi:hypothetical protein